MKKRLKSLLFFLRTNELAYVSAMTIFATILCFFELTRDSFTFDEVTSIIIARNWQSMWHIMWMQEGNMWFYFLILNIWQKLGNSEFILRSLSAFFGILTVPVFYQLAKNIHSSRVAKIATPLFTTSMYFIFYAQMARSYALSLLLVTLSSYLFVKFIKNSSSKFYLSAYVIATTLAIYTHLLVVLAIATQYVYFLFFPKTAPWKKIFISSTIIALCLIPLLLAPSVRNGHQLDWLRQVPLVFLPFGIIALAGDSLLLTVATGCIILIGLWKKRSIFLEKSIKQFYFLWLVLWAGFPILFSYLFSLIVKPIYQPQYFNSSLPAFILLVVICLEELRSSKILYRILLVSLFAFSFLRLVQWYSGNDHYITDYVILENVHPDDWKDTASYISQNGKRTDAVMFYAYYIREPFTYYYSMNKTNHMPKMLEISSGHYDLGGGTKIPEPNTSLLDSVSKKYSRIWLVLENNDTSELGKRTQWNEIEKELRKYYTIRMEKRLNKVEIQLFERK